MPSTQAPPPTIRLALVVPLWGPTPEHSLCHFLVVVVRFVRFLYLDSITKLQAQGRELDRTLHELERTSVSKEHLDNVLGAVRDMILVTDGEGVVIDANPAAREVLEVDIVGRRVDDLLQDLGPSEPSDTRSARIHRSDGRLLPVRVSRGELSTDARGAAGFMGGEIHLESQLGRGSSFRVDLPAPAVARMEAKAS